MAKVWRIFALIFRILDQGSNSTVWKERTMFSHYHTTVLTNLPTLLFLLFCQLLYHINIILRKSPPISKQGGRDMPLANNRDHRKYQITEPTLLCNGHKIFPCPPQVAQVGCCARLLGHTPRLVEAHTFTGIAKIYPLKQINYNQLQITLLDKTKRLGVANINGTKRIIIYGSGSKVCKVLIVYNNFN